jgi:DNA-binding transcriptional LysR family regulator
LITDLESELGFSLFLREKGRLEPTMAGLRFYRAVEENFLGLERLKQIANSILSDATPSLSIACLPVLSTSLLPLVLREFIKRQPDVAVKVEPCGVSEIMQRLQELKSDIALSLEFNEIAGINIEPIFSARVMCALPEGHPLTAKAEITPLDLQGQNVIGGLPRAPGSYSSKHQLMEAAELHPHYSVETDNAHTRYAMVAHGLGISIVEPFAARVWQTQGVAIRPFVPTHSYEYVMAYPHGALRSEITSSFRQVVLDVVKRYDFSNPLTVPVLEPG